MECTKFIAVSKSLREHWINEGLDPNKIEVMYNSVTKPSSSAPPLTLREDLKCLILGQIAPGKNQLNAIIAVQKLRQQGLKISLGIVGNEVNLSKQYESFWADKKKIKRFNRIVSMVDVSGYQTLQFYSVGVDHE